MRSLPIELEKNGFEYIQLRNHGPYYIYKQDYNSGIDYPVGDTPKMIRFYEVSKVNIRPAETIKGKSYPKREVFPKDEDFGKSAWSFDTYERALAKFNDLCDD